MNAADVAGLSMEDAVEQARRRAPRARLRAHGLEWTLMEAGTGDRTLVFLPGALGSIEVFSRQLLHFSRSCRVILLGYPGISDPEAMTASFHEVLEQLDVRQADLIGSSLGAYWLQVFTHASPDVARHLILGNTFVDAEPLQANPLFVREFIDAAPAAEVKRRWIEYVESQPPSELRTVLLELAGMVQSAEELRGRIGTVAHAGRIRLSRVPAWAITVLTCDDDAITHGAMGEALRRAYPDSPHVALPFGGHYPHVNNPHAYHAAIARACGIEE